MRKHLHQEHRARSVDRYDYPAKAVVRSHLPGFFSAGLVRTTMERARVWFFPGPRETEYRGYRALGIPDIQLHGFEWSSAIAARIRAYAPTLPLHVGSLASFLSTRRATRTQCDWANLDFDGIAVSFAAEIDAVVARLDAERAPRLAITSFASRDHAQLITSTVATATLEALVGRPRFLMGRDFRLVGDARAGLALEDRARRYAVARELAICFHLLRAFGGRPYGSRDVAAAATFRRAFDERCGTIRRKIESAAVAHVKRGSAMPDTEDSELRSLVINRRIPLWIDDGLRFAYRTPNERWMWTWAFRFTAPREPQSLDLWVEKLLCTVPPLHVLDANGNEAHGHAAAVCAWCPASGRARHPSCVETSPPLPTPIPAVDEPIRPSNGNRDGSYTFHGDEHIIPSTGDLIRVDAAKFPRDEVYRRWCAKGFTKSQVAAAIAWARGALRGRRRSASR